jgi:hypothetical protein
MALGYGMDDLWFESRPILTPIQPPILGVPGALSLGIKRPGVKLTTNFHLVPRSRMRGAIRPLPQYTFMTWFLVKAQERLYLNLYQTLSAHSETECMK